MSGRFCPASAFLPSLFIWVLDIRYLESPPLQYVYRWYYFFLKYFIEQNKPSGPRVSLREGF